MKMEQPTNLNSYQSLYEENNSLKEEISYLKGRIALLENQSINGVNSKNSFGEYYMPNSSNKDYVSTLNHNDKLNIK